MIRPLTCICLLLAGGSGLYLYQSKHQAQMLDREIERTLKATDVARDRIGVLRGEWALLNEPERLAALSQSHLGLKSLAPSQFVTAAELGARLPPPVAPGTTYTPGYPSAEEEDALVADMLQPATPVALSMPAHPVVAKAAPAAPPRPVTAHPIFAPVVNVSTSPIAAPPTAKPAPPHPASAASASAGPAVAPSRSGIPAPPGMSIGESVARMARSQGGAQAASVSASAPQSVGAPAPQPANYPGSQPSQSVLGGVRPLLPPPVPFGSAMAASIASAR